MLENKEFLSEQIITYLGNKRSLLSFIGSAIDIVLKELKKDKIDAFDVFSGSGIVSRFLKQYCNNLYTNDIEDYCYTLNKCYLINSNEYKKEILIDYYSEIKSILNKKPLITDGIIARLYAPKDDNDIKYGERTFYTTRNAQYLDTVRVLLEKVEEPYKTLLLAPLLYEASTKNNTSGVFKGFYKNSITHIGQFGGDGRNALKRIKGKIELKLPVLSNNDCNVYIYKGDSNEICKNIPKVDLAYLDPPYNQHPYGSNYFMLNILNNYQEPLNISRVSGIPHNWNRSNYNKKACALNSMLDLCRNIKASYILISYNSEGIISFNDMIDLLSKFGNVRIFDKKYNVFRGCRNLKDREIHVKEYLFLLKKEGD